MNSVKILHAVRSAITAIAELLVLFILTFCSSLNGRTIKTARVQPGRIKPWAYSRTLLSCCCGCSWAGCGNMNYADYDDRYADHSENHDNDDDYHDNFVVICKMRTNTQCLFANKCKVYNKSNKRRAIARRTARCCCTFLYVSNFTTASCGFSL